MSNTTIRPFHVAFPVHDLTLAKTFYADLLLCPIGRSCDEWIDFNLYGHQVVAHLSPNECKESMTNAVDGEAVPVRHMGVILTIEQWDALATRLKEYEVKFLIEPTIRFAGQAGEQRTMFFLDPSGNALEFKAFADDAQIFAV